MTFEQLLRKTCVDSEDLEFNLLPLIKLKILSRETKEGAIKKEENITINTGFSNKSRKVKCIPGGKAAGK